MKHEFTLTKNDFEKSFNAIYVGKILKVYVILIAISILIGVIIYSENPLKGALFSVVITAWFVVSGFISYYYRKWKFIKAFNETDEYISQMSAEIVDGELILKTDKTTSSIPRDRIKNYIVKNGIILLYRNDMLVHIVPESIIINDPVMKNWLTSR